MNILVIGNGFDLAHELPTKYTDFLEFIKSFTDCYENVKKGTVHLVYCNTNNQVNSFLKKWFSAYYENENGQSKDEKKATAKIIEEFYDHIKDNFWIKYFLQNNMRGNENWIDFESEISNVVKSITDKMHGLDKNNNYSLYDKVTDWPSNPNDVVRLYFEENYGKEITYKIVRDKLEEDLHKLIRAFEIYLVEYVEKINIKIFSPNIKKIAEISYENIDSVSKVISFNYTNIYEKVYLGKYSTASALFMDYIHGKADISNTIELNNMVLGIDEYLGKKRRNKNIEFISFKKFYQRIHKQTGCIYKKWVDDIRESWDRETEDNKAQIRKCISTGILNNKKINKLYIFGHSLDITDKDILRDLILNDNVYTTIYYHSKDAMGQQIANLVKVIGQDELIKRTGGSTKTIKFVPQQPMEPIED